MVNDPIEEPVSSSFEALANIQRSLVPKITEVKILYYYGVMRTRL